MSSNKLMFINCNFTSHDKLNVWHCVWTNVSASRTNLYNVIAFYVYWTAVRPKTPNKLMQMALNWLSHMGLCCKYLLLDWALSWRNVYWSIHARVVHILHSLSRPEVSCLFFSVWIVMIFLFLWLFYHIMNHIIPAYEYWGAVINDMYSYILSCTAMNLRQFTTHLTRWINTHIRSLYDRKTC